MFDLFSWSHILILLGVALVVVGPKELPRLMHMMGKWAGKARGMANEFKRRFDEMARQTELDELRKEVEALKSNNALTDLHDTLNETAASMHQAAAAPELPDAPRAGEFVVTDTSVGTSASVPAPAPVPAGEAPKP